MAGSHDYAILPDRRGVQLLLDRVGEQTAAVRRKEILDEYRRLTPERVPAMVTSLGCFNEGPSVSMPNSVKIRGAPT